MTFHPALDLIQSPYALEHAKGQGMEEYPSTDYILANWLSVEQTRNKLGLSRQAVMDALNRESSHPQHLRGRIIGQRWYIDPVSVEQYQRRYKER